MKRILKALIFLSLVIVISGCQYSDEYTRWGDTVESVDIERLKDNNIPYKIEDDKVYIPKDAFDKAIYCCS